MNPKTKLFFEIIKKLIFDRQGIEPSNFSLEKESLEYGAAICKVGNKNALFRIAKITPKKIGQFVTVWKRNAQGVTEPYSAKDSIDFLFVCVEKDNNFGIFIFPKSALLKHNIFSQNNVDGKRGFRLYPSWDKPTNKQALKTQQWQLIFFTRS